jgi:peptidoglycan/LPS O-acetylase OafA/YrhL
VKLLDLQSTAPPEAVPDAHPNLRRPQLPALTGLRFFLAAHVLLFHFAPSFFGDSGFGRNLIRAGSSAVSVFFLLSGFILTYTHLETGDSLALPTLNVDITRFWTTRFLRIYPAYSVAFILSAPFAVAQFRVSDGHYGASFAKITVYLLMLQAWIPDLWHYWNYPAWSLSAEAFFYALFPALVVIIAARKLGDRLFLAVAWMAGLIVPILVLDRVEYQWLLASPPLHLPEFIFGMLAGKQFIANGLRPPLTSSRFRRWAGPIAAIAIVLADGCGWFPPALLDHALLAPLVGILFFSLARNESRILAFLRWRPIVYLGEVSYGIYILQFPVFTGCFVIAKRLGIPWDTYTTFMVGSAVLVIAASLSFELIETPARRWGTRWFRERLLSA